MPYLEKLEALAEELSEVPELEQWLNLFQGKYHFSVTQSHQLKKLLRRFLVQLGDSQVLQNLLNKEGKGKTVLLELNEHLLTIPASWGETRENNIR